MYLAYQPIFCIFLTVMLFHFAQQVCQVTAQEHDTLDKLHLEVEERLKTAKSETEEVQFFVPDIIIQ